MKAQRYLLLAGVLFVVIATTTLGAYPRQIVFSGHVWFNSGIPIPGDENPRINFWLFRGRGPRAEAEVILKRFEFVP